MACNTDTCVEGQLVAYALAKLHDQRADSPSLIGLEDTLVTLSRKREPNLVTECRILKAVLQAPRLVGHEPHVKVLLDSVCEHWWTGRPSLDQVRIKTREFHQLLKTS